MTIINVTPKVAPPVSNLTAQGNLAGTGINLNWSTTIDPEMFATEIWVSATNDRSTATLYATEKGTSRLFTGTVGVNYYFWSRSVNIYNYSSGDWYPSGSTAGISATIGLIDRSQITVHEVTEITTYTAGVINLTNPAATNGALSSTNIFTAPAVPLVDENTTRVCFLSVQIAHYDSTPGTFNIGYESTYHTMTAQDKLISFGLVNVQTYFVPFYIPTTSETTNLSDFVLILQNGYTAGSHWDAANSPFIKQASLTIFTGKR